MKYRVTFSVLFILTQIVLIVYARYTPLRFFCWAPYDIHTKYEINAIINDSIYGPKQLESRYNYSMEGWEQRSIHNIFYIIEQYENTYGKYDSVEVKALYSINGRKEEEWIYKN